MSKFLEAINHNWQGWDINPGASRGCPDCFTNLTDDELDSLSDEDAQAWEEGSFSWQECESCGSTLGGDRFPAHALNQHIFKTGERSLTIHHVDICSDCLMFHANGDEPEDWGT